MVQRATFLVVLLLALQTALATTYPLTVHDELGAELMLPAPPQRIVSMIPSDTETVCALGACDRLVGVDALSDWPARVASLPRLGNANDPNLERLVALKPDLVLTDEYSGLAGRTIVQASMGEYPQVDPEYVVQKDPQVVLLLDAPNGQMLAAAEARPGWSQLRAVRDGGVVALDWQQVDLLSRAGPRMGDAVVLLAWLLHPGRF